MSGWRTPLAALLVAADDATGVATVGPLTPQAGPPGGPLDVVVTVDNPVLQKPEQTVRVRVRRAGEGVPGARVQISEIYRGASRSFTLPPTDDDGATSYTGTWRSSAARCACRRW